MFQNYLILYFCFKFYILTNIYVYSRIIIKFENILSFPKSLCKLVIHAIMLLIFIITILKIILIIIFY